jgi:hypothetical protein
VTVLPEDALLYVLLERDRHVSARLIQAFLPSADHGPEATQHLKAFIGDHYAYSDKPVFKALWDSYNQCQFVENEGEKIFAGIDSAVDGFLMVLVFC